MAGWRTVLAVLKSTHPGPSLAVAIFCGLFGVGISIEPWKIFLVGLGVLLQQFSVGLSNDWLDFERDLAVARKDKATAQGLVSANLIRNCSVAAGAFAILVAAQLSALAAVFMVLMLVIGWAYNLGLKTNAFSVVPYALGFGALPVFVGLAVEPIELPEMWVILVAALLGTSAHFANALPDLIEDRATGVKALPHILGQRVSAGIIAATAIAASLLILARPDNFDQFWAWIGLALTVLCAGTSSVLSLRPRPPRVVFSLLVLASLVNVVMLMLSLLTQIDR